MIQFFSLDIYDDSCFDVIDCPIGEVHTVPKAPIFSLLSHMNCCHHHNHRRSSIHHPFTMHSSSMHHPFVVRSSIDQSVIVQMCCESSIIHHLSVLLKMMIECLLYNRQHTSSLNHSWSHSRSSIRNQVSNIHPDQSFGMSSVIYRIFTLWMNEQMNKWIEEMSLTGWIH